MSVRVTKTDLQRREHFRRLDSKKGYKILQEILTEINQRKEKKMLDVFLLKGLNSKFQRQINRIQSIRNTKNTKCRNKWNTVFHQEISKCK